MDFLCSVWKEKMHLGDFKDVYTFRESKVNNFFADVCFDTHYYNIIFFSVLLAKQKKISKCISNKLWLECTTGEIRICHEHISVGIVV